MKGELRDSQLAVEQAGRATKYLLALSGVLLLATAAMFMIIITRENQLQDSIREDAIWAIHQFDRETRELAHIVAFARAAQAPGDPRLLPDPTPEDLVLRYDILYSRMVHLQEADLNSRFTQTTPIRGLMAAAAAIVTGIEPVFNAINAQGMLDLPALSRVADKLQRLENLTSTLLVRTNAVVATSRADSRSAILTVQTYAFGLILALGICTTLLILNLMRQMRLVYRTRLKLSQAAQDMSQAYQQAEAGNRAKSVFMATIGHEIRTPLNAILGMAELLSQSRLPEKELSNVRTIARSGQLLLEMLNEVLDFAKFEHGLAPPEAVPFRISDVVGATVALMQGRAVEHNNRLSVDLMDVASTTYVGDPKRVEQVLLNLLSNAIKFTANGDVCVQVHQEVRARGCWLTIAVSDTGIGIAENARAQLFTPFNQLDASIARHYGGTGLGLAICKQLAESLGGTIEVDSAPNRGSVFSFAFPVRIAATQDALSTVERTNKIPPEPLPALSILLVEDNPINQQIANAFLSSLGQAVCTASSGLQALSEMRSGTFDLVLMDVQMPEMDGIAATRAIKRLGPDAARVPIVAMTANASDDDRTACLEAGMVEVKTKPMTLSGLATLIRRFAPSPHDDMASRARPKQG
ncbi:signal transduction histidine kinase [Breoghania corrubedonensis]|uniref:histidine kinase n=1 Tax=Breoghania corrubedonensis TaxID=665038 RepID=A0A2T5UU85_9HYPH|nr:ATP-binding protein [Breoghania corrubedonensis]PTW55065.1 signal transduction histidine kinase [Breoghania corrubedonensis]